MNTNQTPNIGRPDQQRDDPQRSQEEQQNLHRGDHRDPDAGEDQDPESVRGGRRGGYGQGISGGVDVGAIEPGRTQKNGAVDS